LKWGKQLKTPQTGTQMHLKNKSLTSAGYANKDFQELGAGIPLSGEQGLPRGHFVQPAVPFSL